MSVARAAGWGYLVVVTGLFILTGLLVLTSTAAPASDPEGQARRFGYFGMAVLAVPVLLGALGGVLLARRSRRAYVVVLLQGVLGVGLWGFGSYAAGSPSNLVVALLCLAVSLLVVVAAVQAVRHRP